MCHDTVKHSNENRRDINLALFGESGLCSHCDGTGNELDIQYRECPKCEGAGNTRCIGIPVGSTKEDVIAGAAAMISVGKWMINQLTINE